VTREPVSSRFSRGLQRSGLFEQMRRSRNDHQLVLAMHRIAGGLVQLDHHVVKAADQQQGWRGDLRQGGGAGEVGPPAT